MAILPHSSNNLKGLDDFFNKLKDLNHEKLLGLLGGDSNGHFHLTQNELTKLISLPDDLNSLNHENLMGLLGGNASGHYHLTQTERDKLIAYPKFNELNHEQLNGLLGGDSSGHYHLTAALLDKISNLPASITQNHEGLSGLLGGNSSGHYHLTQVLLDKLINMPASGTQGSDGKAATIQIGTVTTGAAGTNASVTNSGTPTNAIFNFVIPRGAKGDKGDKGDSDTSSDNKYRLVKINIEGALDYATENKKLPDNPGMLDFTIPEGVDTICISGCGGGGGMTLANLQSRSGWSAGDCINMLYRVKAGDIVSVYAGRGGVSVGYTSNAASRGEDSVVFINNKEVLRLGGGSANAHVGNQTGHSKASSYYLPSNGVRIINNPSCTDSDICRLHHDLKTGFGALSGDAQKVVTNMYSILNCLCSPRTLFSPYGEGASFSSSIGASGGYRGIIIIEYVEPVIL